MTHSKEPWKSAARNMPRDGIDACPVYDKNGKCVVDVAWYENGAENADRIVACINFCRQFPTKFLECRQAVNLDHPPEPSHKYEETMRTLSDIPRFSGLMAVQRNE